MAAFSALAIAAAVAAMADWVAVGVPVRRLQYAAKPGTLAALTAAAAVLPADHIDLVQRRWWFVAALACCLVGDVLLMVPADLFIPGLVAFLAGHVLFIGGLLQPPSPEGAPPFSFSPLGIAVAAVVVLGVEAAPGTMLIGSLLRRGQASLVGPLCLYVAAIGTMVVLATNAASPLAAAGAALFLLSDTLLALNRFVRPIGGGSLAVHVSYHLAQGCLVLSLLR